VDVTAFGKTLRRWPGITRIPTNTGVVDLAFRVCVPGNSPVHLSLRNCKCLGPCYWCNSGLNRSGSDDASCGASGKAPQNGGAAGRCRKNVRFPPELRILLPDTLISCHLIKNPLLNMCLPPDDVTCRRGYTRREWVRAFSTMLVQLYAGGHITRESRSWMNQCPPQKTVCLLRKSGYELGVVQRV